MQIKTSLFFLSIGCVIKKFDNDLFYFSFLVSELHVASLCYITEISLLNLMAWELLEFVLLCYLGHDFPCFSSKKHWLMLFFSLIVFNQKTLYNAYKKRTKNIEVDLDEYNKMKEADAEFYREATSLQYGKVPRLVHISFCFVLTGDMLLLS